MYHTNNRSYSFRLGQSVVGTHAQVAGQTWTILVISLLALMSTSGNADGLKIPNLLSAAFGVGSTSSANNHQLKQSQSVPSTSSVAMLQQQQTDSTQQFTTSTPSSGGPSLTKPLQSLLPSRHHALLFSSLPKSLFGRLTASGMTSSFSPTSSTHASSHLKYNMPLFEHYQKKMKSLGLGKRPALSTTFHTNSMTSPAQLNGVTIGNGAKDYVDLASLVQQQAQIHSSGESRYPYGPDGSSDTNKAHSVPHHLLTSNSDAIAEQLNTVRLPQYQHQQPVLADSNNQQQQSMIQVYQNHPNHISVQHQTQDIEQHQPPSPLTNQKDDIKAVGDISMLVDEELRKLESNMTINDNNNNKELLPDLFIDGAILKTAIEGSIEEENSLNRNISSHASMSVERANKQIKKHHHPHAQPIKSVNVTELVSKATSQQQQMNQANHKELENVFSNVTTLPLGQSNNVSLPAIASDKPVMTIVEVIEGGENLNYNKDAPVIISEVNHHPHKQQPESLDASATASNVARMNGISGNVDEDKIENFILGPYRGPQMIIRPQQQRHSFSMPLQGVNYAQLHYPTANNKLTADQQLVLHNSKDTIIDQSSSPTQFILPSSSNHPKSLSNVPPSSPIYYSQQTPQQTASNSDFMLDLSDSIQDGKDSSHQQRQQRQQKQQQQQHQHLRGQKLYNYNKNDQITNQINELDHQGHQLMRETNPKAINRPVNPVHMLHHHHPSGGHLTHQHQPQHYQLVRAMPTKGYSLPSMYHLHNQHHQSKFVDSPYRLETNNRQQVHHERPFMKQQRHSMAQQQQSNMPKYYMTDTTDNAKANNFVNKQKMLHSHYTHQLQQQQPGQQMTQGGNDTPFLDISTGALIDFGGQSGFDSNPNYLSDNSIAAYMQQQPIAYGQPPPIHIEPAKNSQYNHAMTKVQQQQQMQHNTFNQYTAPMVGHYQQQPQKNEPVAITSYYSSMIINHGAPVKGADQEIVVESSHNSKFKSGLYQIDPPKLVNETNNSHQAQHDSSMASWDNGPSQSAAANGGDVNSINDTKQNTFVSEPDQVDSQQDSHLSGQEDNQNEDNGEASEQQQQQRQRQQQQQQQQQQMDNNNGSSNNFTLTKQVGAILGVSGQQNKLHQTTTDDQSLNDAPIKGKVFNEPLFTKQSQPQQQQDDEQERRRQQVINNDNQGVKFELNHGYGETKEANGRVRHPSSLTTGGKKANEYGFVKQQQQPTDITPGYSEHQQQQVLATPSPFNLIQQDASTIANTNNMVDASIEQQQQDNKQPPLLDTEVYTIPYTIQDEDHHRRPDQDNFINQQGTNHLDTAIHDGKQPITRQPQQTAFFHMNRNSNNYNNSPLRQHPAFSPSLLSTIYHSRQQAPQHQVGLHNNDNNNNNNNNNNGLNDQRSQQLFNQQQSFLKTILSNDYNQQQLPQTLIEWRPSLQSVPFLTYSGGRQQDAIEFIPNHHHHHHHLPASHQTTNDISNNLLLQPSSGQIVPVPFNAQQASNYIRYPLVEQSETVSTLPPITQSVVLNGSPPQQHRQQNMIAADRQQATKQQEQPMLGPAGSTPPTTTNTTTNNQVSSPKTIQQVPTEMEQAIGNVVGDLWSIAAQPPTTPQLNNNQLMDEPQQQQQATKQQQFEQSAPMINGASHNNHDEDNNDNATTDQQQQQLQPDNKQNTISAQGRHHNNNNKDERQPEPLANVEQSFNQQTADVNSNRLTTTNLSNKNNNNNDDDDDDDDDDDHQRTNQQQQQHSFETNLKPNQLDDNNSHHNKQRTNQQHANLNQQTHLDIQRATQQQQQLIEAIDSLGQIAPSPSFCTNRPPGLHADESQKCKVYYQCGATGQQQFKCGNQTQFNQKTLTCDWWYNVDCGGSNSNSQQQSDSSLGSNDQPTQEQGSQRQEATQNQSTLKVARVFEPSTGLDNRDQQQGELNSEASHPHDQQSASVEHISFIPSGQSIQGWDAMNSFLVGTSNNNNNNDQRQQQQQHHQDMTLLTNSNNNKQQDNSGISIQPEMFHHSESQSNTTMSTIQPSPSMVIMAPPSPLPQPNYYVTSVPISWSSNTNINHQQQQQQYYTPSVTTDPLASMVKATESSTLLSSPLSLSSSVPQVGAIISDEVVISTSSSSVNSSSDSVRSDNRSGQLQSDKTASKSSITGQQQQQQQQQTMTTESSDIVVQQQQQLIGTISSLTSSPVESPLPVGSINSDNNSSNNNNNIINLILTTTTNNAQQSSDSNNDIVQKQQQQQQQNDEIIKRTNSKRFNADDLSSIQPTIDTKNTTSDISRQREDVDFGGGKSKRLAQQVNKEHQQSPVAKTDDNRQLSVIFDSARTPASASSDPSTTYPSQRQSNHRYTPSRISSSNSVDTDVQPLQQRQRITHSYDGDSFAPNGVEPVYSAENNQGSVSYTPMAVHFLTAKGLSTIAGQPDHSIFSPQAAYKLTSEQNTVTAASKSSPGQSNQDSTPSSTAASAASTTSKLDRRYGERINSKSVKAPVFDRRSTVEVH